MITFLFSLPRSRTQWLTWVFNHFDIQAWHDPLAACTDPKQLVKRIEAYESRHKAPLVVLDTAAIYFHQALVTALPHARRAYLIRPRHEVEESLVRQGASPHGMDKATDRLFRYAYDDGVLRVLYLHMDQRIDELWKFCTGQPVPQELESHYSTYLRARVDVPMSRQNYSVERTRQLMRHMER